ncbi:hypothetical protein JCM11641_008334 [Rhodosporidiobolus odoratus]
MDSDNPWDAPSASTVASTADTTLSTTTDSPPLSPRISYSPGADERPTWGADSPKTDVTESARRIEPDEGNKEDKVTTEEEQPRETDRARHQVESQATQQGAGEGTEGKPAAAEEDDAASSSLPSTPPAPTSPTFSQPSSPVSISKAPIRLPTLPASMLVSEAPPMDDFDSPPSSPPAKAAAAPASTSVQADEAGDDFDDFNDGDFAEGGAEGDDDFGDFGDFGDAAPLDASAFEAPALPPPVPVIASSPTPVHISAYPPLRLDLSNTSRKAIAPQLKEFCAAVWAKADESVNDEPERQVEGPGQVLVTESARNLLADLSTLPPLRPLDWRRSMIRREHLTALGVPVNLDDTEVRPPTLTLPFSARSRFNPHSPSGSPTRSSTTPLPYSASSSSQPPSRTSTPFADRERVRPFLGPPPFDSKRAEELMSIREEDLTLMSLAKLREFNDQLDKVSVEASGVLTHALMMREKEGQDKEIYNGMISDLVTAAAKMKTSSSLGGAGGRASPKRSSSVRWGR